MSDFEGWLRVLVIVGCIATIAANWYSYCLMMKLSRSMREELDAIRETGTGRLREIAKYAMDLQLENAKLEEKLDAIESFDRNRDE